MSLHKARSHHQNSGKFPEKVTRVYLNDILRMFHASQTGDTSSVGPSRTPAPRVRTAQHSMSIAEESTRGQSAKDPPAPPPTRLQKRHPETHNTHALHPANPTSGCSTDSVQPQTHGNTRARRNG